MRNLFAHLQDNRGDENITKMIWVCIVFVVGAILLSLIATIFRSTVSNWYQNVMKNWFNSGASKLNGKYTEKSYYLASKAKP